MLYVLFFLAVILTILYFTAPGFILRKKFRGRDLYEILSEEEHNNRLKILGRGVHSIIYLIVYYPTLFLAIPLVILWAILNGIGLQVVSYIATRETHNSWCYNHEGRDRTKGWNKKEWKENIYSRRETLQGFLTKSSRSNSCFVPLVFGRRFTN